QPDVLRATGKAAVIFCVANMIGLLVGIEIRTGTIAETCFATKPESALSVAGLVNEKAIGSDVYLRLLITQRVMQNGGIPANEINAYLRSLVETSSAPWKVSDTNLKQIEEVLRHHRAFLDKVRNGEVKSRLTDLRQKLQKNNVDESHWKASLTD